RQQSVRQAFRRSRGGRPGDRKGGRGCPAETGRRQNRKAWRPARAPPPHPASRLLPTDRQGGSCRGGPVDAGLQSLQAARVLFAAFRASFCPARTQRPEFRRRRRIYPAGAGRTRLVKNNARPMPKPAARLRLALQRTVSTGEIAAAKLGEIERPTHSPANDMTTGIPPPRAVIAGNALEPSIGAAPAFVRRAPGLLTAWLLV